MSRGLRKRAIDPFSRSPDMALQRAESKRSYTLRNQGRGGRMTAGAVGETRSDGRQAFPRPLNDTDGTPLTSSEFRLPDGQEVLTAVLEAVTVGVVVQHRDGTPLVTNSAAQA